MLGVRPKQKPNNHVANFPSLPTLDQTPSWLNARGFIDRSACIEIRVSEIRRLAGCVKIDRTQHDEKYRPLHLTTPLPNEKPARRRYADGSQRLVTGVITITARQLHELHQCRMPRLLAGDFRTNRANVMKAVISGQMSVVSDDHSAACGFARSPQVSSPKPQAFRSRITRAQPIAWPPDRGLSANPNKGAARSKIIGLTADWSQPIRVEKWIYPNRIRPVYFMICPGQRSSQCRVPSAEHTPTRNSELGTRNCPPLSTRRPGRLDPSVKDPSGAAECPQRCLKLLMVQCTKAEARDADLAQLWIDSLPPRFRRRLSPLYQPFINKLLTRYGLIMFPRVLLCPRCLKVRYGNNPETVRQGWRRRNKKPDTSVTGNAHLLGGRRTYPLSGGPLLAHRIQLRPDAHERGEDEKSKSRNVETSKRAGTKPRSGVTVTPMQDDLIPCASASLS